MDLTDPAATVWFSLAGLGFFVGLWFRPKVLLRIALGLFMLAGLGLLLTTTMGHEVLAFWCGAAMVALVVCGAAGILGSIVGLGVRRMVRGQSHQGPRRRPYNSII